MALETDRLNPPRILTLEPERSVAVGKSQLLHSPADHALKLLVASNGSASNASPFFQIFSAMAAILRASVSRRRPRGQNRLLNQTAALIQHRRGNRVPVDIKPDISHTVHLGVPLFSLGLTASPQQPQLTRKGRPFILRGPGLTTATKPGAPSSRRFHRR